MSGRKQGGAAAEAVRRIIESGTVSGDLLKGLEEALEILSNREEERKDAPLTTRELMDSCDRRMLASGLVAAEGAETADDETREFIYNECLGFVSRLSEIAPKRNDGMVLLAVPEYERGERRLRVCLFGKEDLLSADVSGKLPNPAGMTADEIFAYAASEESSVPRAYSYMLEPWEDILGYATDAGNVEEYGKYLILAEVLSTMAVFGMETESRKFAEKESLAEKAEAARMILENPEEDCGARFISSDEVFAAFGYRDGRSDEEKSASYRRMAEDAFMSLVARRTEVRKYQERNGNS